MELIDQHVESLIFTSGQPISEAEITTSVQRALDEKISKEEVDASIERLIEKYKSENFAFEIVPISRGYHFMTKGSYHTTVGEHLKVISKKKLSRAALETLSIIAYKQPVTRIDLESIRGVSCDYTIQKLMEKELVEMQGRAEGPGRPLLYGTSEKFMDYFGIKDLKDLPKPKDFEMPETEVGEPAPIEVVVPTESNESAEKEPDGNELTTSNEIKKEIAKELERGNVEEPEEVESMMEVEEVRSESPVIKEGKELQEETIEVEEFENLEGQTNSIQLDQEAKIESNLGLELLQDEDKIETQNSSQEEE